MSSGPKPPFPHDVEPAHSNRATVSMTRPAIDDPRADRLAELLRMPRTGRDYRDACRSAIAIAAELGFLRFELEDFVRPYLATRLTTAADVQALFTLGALYEANQYDELARAFYERVLNIDPTHIARSHLEALEHSMAAPRTQEIAFDAQERETASSRPPHADMPPDPFRIPSPGAILGDRYMLEATIGRGATSTVFQAHDRKDQRAVAVKVLSLSRREGVQVERFKRELELAQRLVHPNIASLYDLDLHADPPFLVMELLVGENLDVVVGNDVSIHAAASMVAQAAAGLGCAHRLGVIHRDVKSENLFLTTQGAIKVMDFGMAKVRGADSLTADGITGGTPLYISPEQITDFRTVTHRADIYSLGVVAFELFTGRLPFENDQLVGLLRMHLETAPPDPRDFRPDLPAAFAHLVLAMLEKEPKKRIPDCATIEIAVAEALAGLM